MSKVSIVNRALTFLGANRITSLSDGTLEAQCASNIYDESLKSVLAECDWKFATKRTVLNRLAVTPAWNDKGMKYAFQLPSDFIAVFGVMDPHAVWDIEGDTLLSNAPAFGIKYVFFCTDANKYPAFFVDAFACKLAADMCYEITNSNEKAFSLLELYKGEYLPVARTKNSRECSTPKINDSEWVHSIVGGIFG